MGFMWPSKLCLDCCEKKLTIVLKTRDLGTKTDLFYLAGDEYRRFSFFFFPSKTIIGLVYVLALF